MMGTEDEGGFLSRWARRKAQARSGGAGPAEQPPVRADTPPSARPPVQPSVASTAPADAAAVRPDGTAAAAPEQPAPGESGAPGPAAPPPPTLEDAQALTPESDFRRFARADVDPQVRNLAMKKLFADPHFNVMDGLDIYIDDYNTPDPLPQSMLRQLVQARTLGLLDDELEEQPQPAAVTAPEGVAADASQGAPGETPDGGADGAPDEASQPDAADQAVADAVPVSAGQAAAEPGSESATEPAVGPHDEPASLSAATAGEPAAHPATAPVIPIRLRSPSPPAG